MNFRFGEGVVGSWTSRWEVSNFCLRDSGDVARRIESAGVFSLYDLDFDLLQCSISASIGTETRGRR